MYMAKTPAQRTILNLKPRSECVEGLRRYSAFFDLTMTRFLERQIHFCERRLLDRLPDDRRTPYLNNSLTLAALSDDERAAFNTPPAELEHPV
jgi:hypothetical protein